VDDSIRELRGAVAALPAPRDELGSYLEKVRTCAYTITDDDVAALKRSGLSDDEIFEQTVAVAVGEGLRRLDAGLATLA